jgi:cytochrome c oxidase assembly protein subunit 15
MASRWLHSWAVLTTAAVFPLILSGGAVTSLRAGMADPEWPSPPWYLLVTSWAQTVLERGRNFLIEHGHRQIGWLVGILAIILAIGLWRQKDRRELRWLGLIALAAVCFQGLLGGFRVRLDALFGIELAMIHGFTGQLVFALLAGICLLTSRSWREAGVVELEDPARMRRLFLTTTALLVLQLGLGVWLRQQGRALEAHVLVALAIVTHVFLLHVRLARSGASGKQLLSRPVGWMSVLVVFQAGLGLAAWLLGAGAGAFDHREIPAWRAILSTIHVAVGALLLAASVIASMRAWHHVLPRAQPLEAAVPSTGGAS